MNQTQVVIAGGGPTGLMLACELRLHGVGVIVLDRAAGRSGESRAGGLHARTLEMLEHRGIVDRFLRLGRPIPAAHFSGIWLDVSPLETRYPYVLGLVQARIEEVLEERAAELGVQVRWDSEVCGVSQDDGSVTVRLQDGSSVHADYLVGCDGGRSAVRRLAGIGFSGTGPTVNSMLADVLLTEDPGPIFMARRPGGDFTILQLEPGYHRVITNQYDAPVDRDLPLDFETVRATFVSLAGKDFGMHSPLWVSRYNDAARLADTYRSGRVFLAGDAAHIHWPAGGQGLNTGVQDAMNLGWKLALALEGVAGAELLDSYEVERRPVAQRVLDNTRAQVALARPGSQVDALRSTMTELFGLGEVNRKLAGMITGLDIGVRAPDVALHDGRAVLSGGDAVLGRASGWGDRVHLVPGPDRLVRPDGYVAWSGGEGLTEALTSWCGLARAAA
jgi:2-polyprenyl-6-methoxyphenol hydroxylase-like FAD-dependent oxidoreductase